MNELEGLWAAMAWLHEIGGAVHFYGCSGLDVVALRFFKHCDESKVSEWTTPANNEPGRALIRLHKAVCDLSYEDRMKGGEVLHGSNVENSTG